MDLSFEASLPIITVFAQGLLSFFSPCVLPLIPLYMGYLAGGALECDADGALRYPRGRVLVNTVFFVVGVSFAFFLLGFGVTALGRLFTGNERLFSIAAGAIMVLFGLYMLGVFGTSHALETERRLPFNLNRFAMNPLVALALGFTFSFAWTPCVGPVLAGVLVMASSQATAWAGYALVAVYTAGFALPFLAVGLAAGAVLTFIRNHGSWVRYTVKAGGALLIVMGLMTATGWMGSVAARLASLGGGVTADAAADAADEGAEAAAGADAHADGSAGDTAPGEDGANAGADGAEALEAPLADLAFIDQHGTSHRLADYRGKTVLLNFFATWCDPCQSEIPELEELYRQRGANAGDVVLLAVANPSSAEYPQAADVSEAELGTFIDQQGITYPVLMDLGGDLLAAFGVSAFPTTYVINPDGTVAGYIPGALTREGFDQVLAGLEG